MTTIDDHGSQGAAPVETWRRWRGAVLAAAVVLPVVTGGVLAAFRDQVAASSAVLLLVLWVVAAAGTGDRWSGLLAAVAGAVSFDYFLTEPYLDLKIDDPQDAQVTALLLLIGVAVSEIALWGRRQQAAASRRAGYLDGIVDVAGSVARSEGPPALVAGVVADRIADVLGADECRFVAGPVHDTRVAVLTRDGDLVRDGRVWDADRSGLPTDEYVAVPASRAGDTLGHFLVTASTRVRRPTREQRRVAVLLAEQLLPALADRPDAS